MAQQRTLRPFNGRRGKPASAHILPAGEYIVNTPDGLGVKLSVSNGPHGLGVTVTRHVGTPALEVMDHDASYTSIVQYRETEQARAFQRWYQKQETEQDIAVLGESYRRKR